jgi:hypothetical protein
MFAFKTQEVDLSPDIDNYILNNFISVSSTSRLTGYSQQYLRRLLRMGKLQGIKVGQIWLISLPSLECHLQKAQSNHDQRFGPRGNGNDQNYVY